MQNRQTPAFFGCVAGIAVATAICAMSGAVRAQAPAVAPPVPPSAPADAAPVPPAPAAATGSVKFGKETKITLGKVIDVERADNGCLINFKNDKGDEFIELGLSKFCMLKPPLKGKQIEMEYRMETVSASECAGNSKCKKTESLPIVVEVKVLN